MLKFSSKFTNIKFKKKHTHTQNDENPAVVVLGFALKGFHNERIVLTSNRNGKSIL